VVQLVERERLAEVLAHGRQRGAQVARRALAELRDREVELIRRDADPLIRRHQRRACTPREIRVLRVLRRLLFTTSATP
jgi:hypothetical protein